MRIKHPAASYGVLTSLFKLLAFANLRSKERGIEPEEIKDALTDAPLITAASLITADAGYHSEANLKQLAGMEVDALIADNGMRQRDPRFKDQDKHKQNPNPLHNKSGKPSANKKAAVYRPADFHYDPETHTCVCPAGKTLYGNGSATGVRYRLELQARS